MLDIVHRTGCTFSDFLVEPTDSVEHRRYVDGAGNASCYPKDAGIVSCTLTLYPSTEFRTSSDYWNQAWVDLLNGFMLLVC